MLNKPGPPASVEAPEASVPANPDSPRATPQGGHPRDGEGLARPAMSIREVAGDSEEVGRQVRRILAQPATEKAPRKRG